MKFIKDVDTGEIFPIPDDTEEQINEKMPTLYKDEITPKIKVDYSGIDGVNDLMLQMSHELEEEKERKTVYHKFPFAKIISTIAICSVLIIGCVFGVRYVSNIDFESNPISIEASVDNASDILIDSSSENTITNSVDISKNESQIDSNFIIWSSIKILLAISIGLCIILGTVYMVKFIRSL